MPPLILKLTDKISFDLNSSIASDGFRALLLAESGAGKSFGAALLLSQWIQQGHQAVVLDAHGEYGSMAILARNIMFVGYNMTAGPNVLNLSADPSSIEHYLEHIRQGKSIFFNLREWVDTNPARLNRFAIGTVKEDDEDNGSLGGILPGVLRLRKRIRKRTLLLVEEAHNFAPQRQLQKADAIKARIFMGIATGGRKFGISTIYCSQRPALIDKSAISQCNLRLIGRMSENLDWEAVEPYLKRTKISQDDLRDFANGDYVLICRWAGKNPQRVRLLMPDVHPTPDLPDFL